MDNERELLLARVETYFSTMDRGAVAETVACFAENGTLVCETNDMRLSGQEELREFFTRITTNTHEMIHEVTATMVDVQSRRCAAELQYRNKRKVGSSIDTAVCNVFDFDEQGRFTRVRFWTADVVVPAAQDERG